MKVQIIQIPDTMEVKEIKDGKIILVEKEKKLTYEDIAKKLNYIISLECTSNKQARKLFAINKLMNVAKYLNGNWQPDWDEEAGKKWHIVLSHFSEQIRIAYEDRVQDCAIYFKSAKLAEQAIEILGEETIKLALCTDY